MPESQRTANNTLLAWADQLPFKSNSLDYIVSLHNLEHLQDPVQAVLHYLVSGCGVGEEDSGGLDRAAFKDESRCCGRYAFLGVPAQLLCVSWVHPPARIALPFASQDMLKPGGGLGVAVPNWRYTWDARTDATQWGHRWNSAPEVACRLHLKYWSHLADLEQLNTLKCELGGQDSIVWALIGVGGGADQPAC